MRVLIAEDDPLLLLILQTTLKQAGHDCLTAKDGLQAWQMVQTNALDVVISDWKMPGLEGIELCRRIRTAPQPRYVYFILLTGLGDKTEMRNGIAAGADDYLLKPLKQEELHLRLMVAERLTTLHAQLAKTTRELERVNRQLAEQGRTDALTRVGNRLRLHEDLEALAVRARRHGERCCAAMCDVDHFKRYNDTFGHTAGDEVLRKVAAAIKDAVRVEDGVYRYGGEEFLLILPGRSLASTGLALERVRNAVQDLAIACEAAPSSAVITISVGVAALDVANGSVERMLEEADLALYRAKAAGRNNVQVGGGAAARPGEKDAAKTSQAQPETVATRLPDQLKLLSTESEEG